MGAIESAESNIRHEVSMLAKIKHLVPKRGLEPPLPDGNYTLNVARLPIPPLRHMDCWSRSCNRARTVGRIAPIAVSHLAIQPRACQACRYYSFRNSSRAAKGRLTIERPEATEKSTTAGGLTGTNLWIQPTPDHGANLPRFTSDPSAPLPSLFISSPLAKDPDLERRHPGRATLEVICPAPYNWFARWEDTRWKRRGQDYDDFKQSLTERLRSGLEEHVPAVRGKLDIAELSTPLSTRHFMNYQRGEAYGVSATPARFRLRCLTPTPIGARISLPLLGRFPSRAAGHRE